jgi:hypothetical protein
MPKAKVLLRCSECGVTQDAACACAAAIIVIRPSEAVTKYDKVHPDKSAKEVARATGANAETVRRVRRAESANVDPGQPKVAKVTGKDGKSYPANIKQPALPVHRQFDKLVSELVTFTDNYCPRLKLWIKAHDDIEDYAKDSLKQFLQNSANELLLLAQTIDGR